MNIALRLPCPDDLDILYRWDNDPDAANTLDADPPSRHQLWQFLQDVPATPRRDGQMRLIICADGVPAGTIDVCDYSARHSHAFVSIYIAPAHRHRNIGRCALLQAMDICRDSHKIHVLAAYIAASNIPSLHLFAACGFRQSGILHGWLRQGRDHSQIRSDAYIYTATL